MALRLRKDVQKASYYVWFLGAQEAKALRGTRSLLPMIPRMVEKSKEQEPLKVTLQVSHKGLKIVQGSAKHFIPHGAITCSVQTEDIVACTLLLYNPATKCPLHVHAYRCDSELTAQALHDQLQVLINRPENQKRFTELEARIIGLTCVTNVDEIPLEDEPITLFEVDPDFDQ
uniref:PID domain-containing protein n=1 Tax=Anopheles culicifacies TaxID=139723 RepID=A0A182MC88_9DIPT